MKKYTIKRLMWTEVEKNNFLSNYKRVFRVYKKGNNHWVMVEDNRITCPFDTKEEAIEEANNRYQEIAKEFLDEVEGE